MALIYRRLKRAVLGLTKVPGISLVKTGFAMVRITYDQVRKSMPSGLFYD